MDQRVETVINQAREAPSIGEALEAYEKAAACADRLFLYEDAMEVRIEWMETAQFAGFYEQGLAVFDWCLKAVEDQPQHYDEAMILWPFKWAIQATLLYPDWTRERIGLFIDDMESRFLSHRWGPRGAAYLRVRAMEAFGDEAGMEQAVRVWLACDPDEGQDCIACEHDFVVGYFARTGQDQRALDASRQLLDGTLSCHEVPGRTYGHLLEPLVRMSDFDQAAFCYQRARHFVEEQPTGLNQINQLLCFQLYARQPDRAVALAERYLPDLTRQPRDAELIVLMDTITHLFADEASEPLVEAAAEALNLSATRRGAIVERLRVEIDAFAGAMDRRNGNPSFSERLAGQARYIQSGVFIPLDEEPEPPESPESSDSEWPLD